MLPAERSRLVSAVHGSCPLSIQRRLFREYVLRVALQVILSVLLCGAAVGEVGTTVYLSEPNMVLEPISDSNGVITYPEIMVGTRLSVVIDANETSLWTLGLFIEPPDIGVGTVEGRGYVDDPYDPNDTYYVESAYPAAGVYAIVIDWVNETRQGLILQTHWEPYPGDWFGLDYTANEVGLCRVRLKYWYPPTGTCTPPWCKPPFEIPDPPEERIIQELVFQHVPSRDFDGDGVVGFSDCGILASCWNEIVSDPNGPCAVDLNGDTLVDFMDFSLFAEFWLERTEY